MKSVISFHIKHLRKRLEVCEVLPFALGCVLVCGRQPSAVLSQEALERAGTMGFLVEESMNRSHPVFLPTSLNVQAKKSFVDPATLILQLYHLSTPCRQPCQAVLPQMWHVDFVHAVPSKVLFLCSFLTPFSKFPVLLQYHLKHWILGKLSLTRFSASKFSWDPCAHGVHILLSSPLNYWKKLFFKLSLSPVLSIEPVRNWGLNVWNILYSQLLQILSTGLHGF